MQNQTALEYLSQKVEEQRAVVVNSILGGNISDYEYRRLVGVIQGLDFGTQLINDLAKRLETDADE
jgi:hypothetical protein